MTRDYRQEFIDEANAAAGFDIAAWLKTLGHDPDHPGPITKQAQEDLADALGELAGRDFTPGEAADWLFSEAGQAAMEAWKQETGEFIEIPAFLARPLDQVFGDRSGVDREALSPRQAAEIAAALADIEDTMP